MDDAGVSAPVHHRCVGVDVPCPHRAPARPRGRDRQAAARACSRWDRRNPSTLRARIKAHCRARSSASARRTHAGPVRAATGSSAEADSGASDFSASSADHACRVSTGSASAAASREPCPCGASSAHSSHRAGANSPSVATINSRPGRRSSTNAHACRGATRACSSGGAASSAKTASATALSASPRRQGRGP